ncbi:MAG: hypothetical protein IJS66_01580 [Bacteroidales bacterium]|nr:hypothetical protein [Bacteroidales bacterium]
MPAKLSRGFSLLFKTPSGTAASVSSDVALEVPRNGGCNLGTVTSTLREFRNMILTADELVDWNENAVFSESATWYLGADIDMAGRSWTPRSDFIGTFDGMGHKIYNFVVETSQYTGFIRTTKEGGKACIKNLTIGSKDGVKWDGVSRFRHSNSANNYTWYYAGIVAKAMGATDAVNLTNFAAIEVDASATGKTRIAGICGNWASTGTMRRCINYGTVTNYASVTGVSSSGSTTLAAGGLGGICAECDAAGLFEECRNYGTVTNHNPGNSTFAGILANTGSACTLRDCRNYGSIVCLETYSNNTSYAGGIMGFGRNCTLTGCVNHKDISMDNFRHIICLGGVMGYLATGKASGCVNEGAVTAGKGTVSNWGSFGGVSGALYIGGTIEDCINRGALSLYYTNSVRAGGICGSLSTGVYVRNCTNDAPVSCEFSGGNNLWAGVAGICGFQEKTADGRVNEVSGCVNNGAVTLLNSTSASVTPHVIGVDAAGIMGVTMLSCIVKNNVNNADVRASNTASTFTLNAGGITGFFRDGTGLSSEGNVNYGNVICNNSGSSAISAGGVTGLVTASTVTASGDRNYGSVTGGEASRSGSVAGVNAGTLSSCGAGGSVNGTVLTASNFSSFVQGSASTGTHGGSTFVSK